LILSFRGSFLNEHLPTCRYRREFHSHLACVTPRGLASGLSVAPRALFDPPELYALLRKENPVTRVTAAEGQPVWLVTRYDDVRAVLTDPRVRATRASPASGTARRPTWSGRSCGWTGQSTRCSGGYSSNTSPALRKEVTTQGVRVVVIEPGMVATELASHITDPTMQAAARDMMNAIRPLRPEDVATAVLYAIGQPEQVAVNEILIRPTDQTA
jgi:hypothetical protein